MIFVGGPLHGQDIDVAPTLAADVVINQPPTLPAAYDDLASGSQWRPFPCRWLGPPNPTTGVQPDLTRHVYVHVDLLATNNMPLIQNTVTNAVLMWWFTTGGTPTVLPPTNGGHRAVYLATCQTCTHERAGGPVGLMSFESLKDRAAWAAEHITATGHSITFSQQAEEAAP